MTRPTVNFAPGSNLSDCFVCAHFYISGLYVGENSGVSKIKFYGSIDAEKWGLLATPEGICEVKIPREGSLFMLPKDWFLGPQQLKVLCDAAPKAPILIYLASSK